MCYAGLLLKSQLCKFYPLSDIDKLVSLHLSCPSWYVHFDLFDKPDIQCWCYYVK